MMFSEADLNELDYCVLRELRPWARVNLSFQTLSANPKRKPDPSPVWNLEGSGPAIRDYFNYLEQAEGVHFTDATGLGGVRFGLNGEVIAPEERAASAEKYRKAAFAWSAKFVVKFVGEIRNAICSGKAPKTTLTKKGAAIGVATALAAWVTQAFGFTNPVAVSVAAMAIHVIAMAGKKSFCEMTDDQAITEIRQKFDL
jgi:hypothetical protein